jgi:phosphatidylglycerol:prolipoprotein diacylglycerol transferase
MHPVLFEFGFVKIFTYGVLVASGFFFAIMLAAHLGKKQGMDPQKIIDLSFYLLIASLVGARLLYIIVEFDFFRAHPVEVFKFWKGGLVFYGGLILAVIVAIVYMKKHQMPVWAVADIIAPSLALGQSIGRWGCFFAGCCYGRKSDVPWAITFTDEKSLAPLGIPLHPTQIYLSLNALVIFLVLLWLSKRKFFDGQIIWAYGILYSTGRFIIEFFRNDDRGAVGMFSTSQIIGLIVFAVSVFMLFSLHRGKMKQSLKT